jgi:hypothetical protein
MWRFKRSFIDPKNGDIKLYYIKPDHNTSVLMTEKDCVNDSWPGVPKDVQKDARKRIRDLRKGDYAPEQLASTYWD